MFLKWGPTHSETMYDNFELASVNSLQVGSSGNIRCNVKLRSSHDFPDWFDTTFFMVQIISAFVALSRSVVIWTDEARWSLTISIVSFITARFVSFEVSWTVSRFCLQCDAAFFLCFSESQCWLIAWKPLYSQFNFVLQMVHETYEFDPGTLINHLEIAFPFESSFWNQSDLTLHLRGSG